MNSRYVQAKLDYLDSLFHDFESQALDEYLSGHIAKYLTVLTSGIYEDIVKNLISALIQREVHRDEIKKFVFNQVEYVMRNPSPENLKKFLNKFDESWFNRLFDGLDDKHRVALFNIVSNKNNIAHGNTSLITFLNIKQYYQDSRVLIERLDKIILGS